MYDVSKFTEFPLRGVFTSDFKLRFSFEQKIHCTKMTCSKVKSQCHLHVRF